MINIASSNVVDLAIIGLTNTGSNTSKNNQTILDASSSTTTTLYENNVAMYVIGRPGPPGSYSRFTTSPYANSWSVGNGTPPGTGCQQKETFPTNTGQSGSLYSDAGGGNLYVCAVGGTWQKATH